MVCDYRDVTIKGYLSTFQSTTPADREGDYVIPGAFAETIPKFMRNPMMLADHRNLVLNAIGSFIVVREDAKGLYVEGRLSNSGAELAMHARCVVAEGILKTLSMGGFMFYGGDGRGINRVELFEGTLCAIPMNPDCLVTTRSLTTDEVVKMKRLALSGTAYDFSREFPVA